MLLFKIKYINKSQELIDMLTFHETITAQSEVKEIKKKFVQATEEKKQYTFSSNSYPHFLITCFVIQEFIKENVSLNIIKEGTSEYVYQYNKKKEVLTDGIETFSYKDNIYAYKVDSRNYSNVIKGIEDITELIDELKYRIKWKNPLKGQFIQIIETNNGFSPIIKKIPTTKFTDVIMDDALKEGIYDNTIFQLKELDSSNGIILHGEPGVGKSHICSAIAQEATALNITVCYLTTNTDYSMLNGFIEDFISPCILIFEDIDSFAESRESSTSTNTLADFLQFVNGIGEREDKIIFIATTNYLEKLDKALANRPVRFNRKFKIEFPDEHGIHALLELYFDKAIADKYTSHCINKQFSGAHIKELQRTVKLLSIKYNKSTKDVMLDGIQLIKENFSTSLSTFGFNT